MAYTVFEFFAAIIGYLFGLLVVFPVAFLLFKSKHRILLPIFAAYALIPISAAYIRDTAEKHEKERLYASLSDDQVSNAIAALTEFCEQRVSHYYRQDKYSSSAVLVNFGGNYQGTDLEKIVEDFSSYKAKGSVCQDKLHGQIFAFTRNQASHLCGRSKDMFLSNRSDCFLHDACAREDIDVAVSDYYISSVASAKYAIELDGTTERHAVYPYNMKLRRYSIRVVDVRTRKALGTSFLYYADIPDTWKKGCMAPREQIQMILDGVLGTLN